MIITSSNIHIENSFEIKKRKEMKKILLQIKSEHPECEVFNRKLWSLCSEWKAHNRLYKLGIEPDRTKSVDLNYPLKWYVELIYNIIGI